MSIVFGFSQVFVNKASGEQYGTPTNVKFETGVRLPSPPPSFARGYGSAGQPFARAMFRTYIVESQTHPGKGERFHRGSLIQIAIGPFSRFAQAK